MNGGGGRNTEKPVNVHLRATVGRIGRRETGTRAARACDDVVWFRE